MKLDLSIHEHQYLTWFDQIVYICRRSLVNFSTNNENNYTLNFTTFTTSKIQESSLTKLYCCFLMLAKLSLHSRHVPVYRVSQLISYNSITNINPNSILVVRYSIKGLSKFLVELGNLELIATYTTMLLASFSSQNTFGNIACLYMTMMICRKKQNGNTL